MAAADVLFRQVQDRVKPALTWLVCLCPDAPLRRVDDIKMTIGIIFCSIHIIRQGYCHFPLPVSSLIMCDAAYNPKTAGMYDTVP